MGVKSMTTKAAAASYLAEHLYSLKGKNYALYNPANKPINELPVIYGFNNGGAAGWLFAVLVAEDGTDLGGHCCSNEAYMKHDLGILEGTRLDRHKTFKDHYPEGYRMDFVPYEEARNHKGLIKAYKLRKEVTERLVKIQQSKEDLYKATGHEYLEPANQYCKHCHKALFISTIAKQQCRGLKNDTKI